MMDLIFRWLATALAIFLVPYLVSGVHVPNFMAALTMSAVLGVLNLLVKPILVVLTLPLTLLSLGVFYLVLNALLFEWAGYLVQGVTVASFGDAFLASLIVSFASWVVHLKRVPIRVRRSAPPRDGDTIELHENEKGKWE